MEIPLWINFQTDHLVTDASYVSTGMDVRTFRGANIDSDHYLLI